MYRLLAITIFILFTNILFGQPDSLKLKLLSAEGIEKVEILQSLTRKYMIPSPDSCAKYGALTVKCAQEIGDMENEAIANKRMGYSYYNIGDYKKSLEYYFRAKLLFVELKEYLEASVVDNFIGDTYTQLGDYDKSIEYFVKAEKSCDTLILNEAVQASAKRLYSILFTNIGILYHKLDSIKKPLMYFEKALKYAKEINDSVRITASYSNIGMVYKSRGNYDEAFDKYFHALEVANKIGHKRFQSAVLNNIANIQNLLGNYDSAMFYFTEAKGIITEIKDKYGLSLVNRNIAGVFLDVGDYQSAMENIKIALAISEEIGSQSEIYQNFEILSKVYESLGDQKQALKYYKLYAQLRDSIQGKETREKIADIRTKYESEKKENENLSLRKDNEIKQMTITRKNQTLVASLVIISILLALIAIIFILLHKRNLAYDSLVRQNLKTLKLEKERESKIRENEFRVLPENKSERTNGKHHILGEEFEKFMIEEKPYLWEDLSMDEICKKLNTNRTYLSKAVNEYYSMSFNDVICDFRIRAAKDLLIDPDKENITIEGIGQMAGFKSNSLFHKKFKSNTGITPLYFREKSK